MDIYSRCTSHMMISSGSVSHAESKNVCIMSVCSDFTESSGLFGVFNQLKLMKNAVTSF